MLQECVVTKAILDLQKTQEHLAIQEELLMQPSKVKPKQKTKAEEEATNKASGGRYSNYICYKISQLREITILDIIL